MKMPVGKRRRKERKKSFDWAERYDPSAKPAETPSSADEAMDLAMGDFGDNPNPKVYEGDVEAATYRKGKRGERMDRRNKRQRSRKDYGMRRNRKDREDEDMSPRMTREEGYGEDAYPMARKQAEDDDLGELDFESLPELDEDDILLEGEELEDSAACPPGCVPAGEEEEEAEGEEEEEAEGEEEEAEEVGAAVEEPAQEDTLVALLAEEALEKAEPHNTEFILFNAQTVEPHYLVLHDGEPVAKIALADQEMPEEHRALFLGERYLPALQESISRVGLRDTLHVVNARVYATEVSRGTLAEKMKTEAAADMEEAFRGRTASLKENLMSTIALAIEASTKNVILQNPLKEALVMGMRRAGVTERGAVNIVEDSFRVKGAEYLHDLVGQAEEWLGMPDEALKQIAAMVSTSDYVHPEDRDSNYQFDGEDDMEEIETPLVIPKNVPLQAVASKAQQRQASFGADELRANLKGRLNLSRKLTSQ